MFTISNTYDLHIIRGKSSSGLPHIFGCTGKIQLSFAVTLVVELLCKTQFVFGYSNTVLFQLFYLFCKCTGSFCNHKLELSLNFGRPEKKLFELLSICSFSCKTTMPKGNPRHVTMTLRKLFKSLKASTNFKGDL